jgi:hypothetical protein
MFATCMLRAVLWHAGFWTIGTVVQAALAYALLNGKGWRILVLVSTTPYVLLLVLLPFVPESPRYLLVKGRVDAAQQVLKKIMRVCGRELPQGTLQPLLPGGGHDEATDSQSGDPVKKKGGQDQTDEGVVTACGARVNSPWSHCYRCGSDCLVV